MYSNGERVGRAMTRCAGYLGYPFQNRAVKSKVSNSIALCLMYHWSEKGLDSVICDAFFRTDSLSS